MKKLITTSLAALSLAIFAPLTAFAHVVVTPATANVGDHVLFNVSVPNERESDVTMLKLNIPKGLDDVQPDVMAGWTITTEKSGDTVSAITWTGTIPVGQRADFAFKAQAPAQAGELDWKAYQTYGDGTVVSWDQKPVANAGDNDAATTGPYSITKVSDDLDQPAATADQADSSKTTLAFVFSAVAFALSALSLVWRRRR